MSEQAFISRVAGYGGYLGPEAVEQLQRDAPGMTPVVRAQVVARLDRAIEGERDILVDGARRLEKRVRGVERDARAARESSERRTESTNFPGFDSSPNT